MTNYIIFPIGDWSCDGHNSYADFLVRSEKSLEEVREAHFKENEFIGSLCKEYEDNKIEVQSLYYFFIKYVCEDDSKAIITKLVDSGISVTNDDESENVKLSLNFDDDDNPQSLIIDSPDDMLLVWISILNVINPSLQLETSSEAMSSYYIKYKGYPHKPVGNINLYGFDEQNRHLETPGYGIWLDHSGEFYHDCS